MYLIPIILWVYSIVTSQGVQAFAGLLSNESREQILELIQAYQELAHEPLACKISRELQGLFQRSLLDARVLTTSKLSNEYSSE